MVHTDDSPKRQLARLLPASVVTALVLATVSFSFLHPGPAVIAFVLGWIMLAIAASDLKNFIVPDVLSLPALVMGFAVTWALAPHLLENHFIAAGAGALMLYAIREGYRLWTGKIGLGLGDVKLAAVAGAWTGITGLSYVLLASCFGAICIVAIASFTSGKPINRQTRIPFGAYLAPAIWLVWLVQQAG